MPRGSGANRRLKTAISYSTACTPERTCSTDFLVPNCNFQLSTSFARRLVLEQVGRTRWVTERVWEYDMAENFAGAMKEKWETMKKLSDLEPGVLAQLLKGR